MQKCCKIFINLFNYYLQFNLLSPQLMHTHTRYKSCAKMISALFALMCLFGVDAYLEGIYSIEKERSQKKKKENGTSKRYRVIRKLIERWKDPSNVDIQLAFSLFTLINLKRLSIEVVRQPFRRNINFLQIN